MMPFLTFGQYDPKMEEYQHKKIITESDTINYQIYSKEIIKEKNKILIYFQGSDKTPLFRETNKSDTIKVVENGITKDIIEESIIINSFVPFDLDSIPNDYIFVEYPQLIIIP